MESILNSTKVLLGIQEDYDHFDQELILNINSVLGMLEQITIDIIPEQGFAIKDKKDTWESLIGKRKDLEMIKTYVYLKVRLAFDPPATSYLINNIQDQVKELEFRLSIKSAPEDESVDPTESTAGMGSSDLIELGRQIEM